MKRIKAWLGKHKTAVASVLAVTVIAVMYVSSKAMETSLEEGATTTAVRTVPWTDQALTAVTRAPLTAFSPDDEQRTQGLLPITVSSASDLLAATDKPGQSVRVAAVNPNSNAVALVVAGRDLRILAGYLLPAQLTDYVAALTAANVNVTITPTVASTSTGSARAGGLTGSFTYPNTASTAEAAAAPARSGGFFTNPWNLIAIVFVLWLVWTIMVRRRQARELAGATPSGGGLGAALGGRKKKDEVTPEVPKVTFADVAGCDEAIADMTELVEFLKTPERFTRTGAKPPKGALLVGPPGTGKTLLAKAVAGEAGVPFFPVSGSDFVEMYVGLGAKRVRQLFAKAKQHPGGAIVFIDEIDAVGRARSNHNNGGGSQESENTLNALLVEMDGFTSSNIIVIGATNRADLLDAALTRPGRLDRNIQVPLPDRAGRERILAVHATDKPLGGDVDLSLIARRTPGMSGAELAQVINEACLTAARDDRDTVTAADFDAALATVAMGKARTSAIVTPQDRLVTAWHEAGHTVAAMVLPDADNPVSVSIIPRGPAGGVTWMAPGDDLFLTRKRAFARLVVAMSGRAAEELLLDGEFTSGPHGDLQSATQTALAMVTQYGMTDAGLMTRSDGLLSTGAKATDQTVEAVEALLAEALDTARATLAANLDVVHAVVDGLLEHDTLVYAQLQEIADGATTVSPKLPSPPKEYRRPPVTSNDGEPRIEVVRFHDPVKPKSWLPKRRTRAGAAITAVAAGIDAATTVWRRHRRQDRRTLSR